MTITVQWAQWDCPNGVKACTTLRHGGVSEGVYQSLNLGAHVGDDPKAVYQNRERLKNFLRLPNEPAWLSQVHGTRVIDAAVADSNGQADGAFTNVPGIVCAVMTADCLPLFLCDKGGDKVGLLHVGWRGLAAGIVEQGVKGMDVEPARLLAWLGPAIGPEQFEIGEEVRAQLDNGQGAARAFRPSLKSGHWFADLCVLTRLRLQSLGITNISQSDACTKTDSWNYFSHRRDGVCGRMASVIWLEH